MDEHVISARNLYALGVAFSSQALIQTAVPFSQQAAMDEQRFRAFYELTARPLWAYLLRVSRNPDLADDLLQESFCRFLAARLPLMTDAESKSYLFRIATNLLRDRWRQEKRAAGIEPPVESREEGIHARAEMKAAFDKLKPRERQLLWLAYVEGSSHQEIAGITGLSVGSIRPLLFRARGKLAAVLRRWSGHAKPEAKK